MIFQKNLINLLRQNLNEDDGKFAVKYLADKNIKKEIIDEFEIGWYNSYFHYGRFTSLGIEEIYLKQLNSLTHRLLVPLYNMYDEVISFSGRMPTYKNGEKIISYYNNETIVDKETGLRKYPLWFHNSFFKRNYLYGLHKSYNHIISNDYVIIVEGIFDLFACYQNGIKNVVCLLGSKITDYHFLKLLRFTNNVILLLDADAAGELGSKEAIELSSNYNIVINKIDLPQGYDPYDFINKYGTEYIMSYLENNILER